MFPSVAIRDPFIRNFFTVVLIIYIRRYLLRIPSTHQITIFRRCITVHYGTLKKIGAVRTLFHRKVNPKIEQLDSYRIELSLIERDSCSFQLTGEPPRRAFEMLRSDVGRERERNVEGAIKRKLFVPAVKITSRFSRNPVLYAKQSLYDSWFTTRCIPIKTIPLLLDTV